MKQSEKPLISVIMPIFNEDRFLKLAIQSILSQTYENFELLLLNDGSTDKSEQIIITFNDRRIRYLKSDRKGLVYQLNKGIKKSKGKIIARMDGDDICYPARFEKQIKYLMDNSDVDVVGSNIRIINKEGKEIVDRTYPEYHCDIEYQMPIVTSLAHPTIMLHKKVFDEVGYYNDKFNLIEDREIFLRMLDCNIKMYNLQENLLFYREGSSSQNLKKYSKKLNKQSTILGENYLNSKMMSKFDYNYRLGLLYYYKTRISRSRSYFFYSMVLSKFVKIEVWRYFLLSLLGDTIFIICREQNIFKYLNYFIKKTTSIQTDLIKK